MATLRDIVTRALKRATILDGQEDADAADAATALAAYNEMAHSWGNQGVDTNHATKGLDDTFPLDAKHEAGTVALLAMRLAGDYELEVSRQLATDARIGWLGLQSDYILIQPMRVDSALSNMPSQRRVR